MSQTLSHAEEKKLLLANGISGGGQVYRQYGTLASSGSSSDTLHEYQILGAKGSEETRIEVTEITEQESVNGFGSAKVWLIFGCICWNEFMANFDSTLMASSHPVITSEFHSSNSASWLSTSFLITSTAFMPLFAPLSDTIGRRPVVLAASTILAVAVAWCAVAPSIGSFIVARTLCGLGAGGTAAMGAVMVNDFVPLEARAKYQSILNIAYGLGQASGVAMGGFLCDTIGWRWAFGAQLPGIVFCGVVFFLAIPNDLGPQLAKHSKGAVRGFFRTFDLTGTILLAVSVTCLILYLNLGGNILDWTDPSMAVVLVVFLLTALFFVRIETKVKHPVLPLKLISSWPRANINFSIFLGALIMNAVIFNIPLYFEVVKHDTPTVAGFRLIPPFLALTASGFLGCMIIRRRGAIQPTFIFSAFLALAGSICLACMGQNISNWAALLLLVPLSSSFGFMSPTAVICLLRTSPQEEHAICIGTFLLLNRLAAVIGVAISTLLVQNLLVQNLHKTVTGPHQQKIIHTIRKSVHSIRDLSALHQGEVVSAYFTSLRITFSVLVIFAIILVVLVIPIKLPKDKEDYILDEA